MVSLTDPNIGYLLAGFLVFWVPTLGYALWMRGREQRLDEEAILLQEELTQR